MEEDVGKRKTVLGMLQDGAKVLEPEGASGKELVGKVVREGLVGEVGPECLSMENIGKVYGYGIKGMGGRE